MKLLRATLIAVSLYVHVSQLHAAQLKWPDEAIHMSIQGKDLKDVLHDFIASQGITAQISPNVQGTVTGQFDMPPQRFFETLAASFGFVWFYDGAVLSITSAKEVTRQVITLNYATTTQLSSTLSQMGLVNPRFPLNYASDARTVVVTGPAQYVQLVSEVAARIDQSAANQVGSVIRVFKLSHAWAADHNVQIDGDSVTVPGVVSVLSQLFHANENANTPVSLANAVRRMTQMVDAGGNAAGGGYPPLPPLLGSTGGGVINSIFNGKPPIPYLNGNQGTGYPSTGNYPLAGEARPGDDKGLPVIQADPATNSVLIRDTPQRIEQYEPIIEQLDVRPKVIEIEAQIISIDNEALKNLGIAWTAHNSHVDLQTGAGTTQSNTYNGTLNPTFGTTTLGGTTVVNTTPIGASISAVLGDAGRYLLARVDALEQTSQAKIEATPKVATLDNVEAIMANRTRFFVPVSGYTSADLYNVSYGTSLRVLPMVVDESGTTMIKLNVHIEDGNMINGQAVGNLPVITTTEINTQAYIGENQSLLIGGYSVQNKSTGVTGIPGLSNIPIIGALFRYNNDSDVHMERLFLITPRILPL
jgi:type III secretion protein C